MMKESSNLHWLQDWYLMRCNGSWENKYGIKIETLDNPGWDIKIDLDGTIYEHETLEYVKIERSEEDWCFYTVEDKNFVAYGGATNLEEMIGAFRNWVEQVTSKSAVLKHRE